MLEIALQVGLFMFGTSGRTSDAQGTVDLLNEPPDVVWPGRHGYLPFF
jgi:hypothetical protein